uniref:Uncharacterized protein n=1 Tax=Tanacetum cinerariifolium TaxID=118510 RepID=A0A6L2KMS0_TANCI|nr:hypothetical protein [Tanacetum cinerariifolium]
MDMTIDQQVVLDEALVPYASRLRIRKSNFRLRSDITSKESTLQLVYDVLRLNPFYKVFLVTADVPEIYMQEFWATAMVHHHSIHFKMDNKKRIVNLEYFIEMMHICPRVPDFVYQVEHKDAKKSNEMYYPRFTKVIIHYFMTKDPLIPRRNKVNLHYVIDDHMFTTINLLSRHQNTQQFSVMLPIELTNEDIRNSEAYKEYYAVASGAAPPKTKARVRKMKSSSDTTVTSPTAAAGTRLSTSAKGKQPAKASKAKSLTVHSEVAMTEAEQLKLATKRSLQQTHISQASGSGANEGTGIIPGVPDDDDDQDEGDDDDDQDEGNDDDQDSDEEGEEFIHPKLSIHDKKETKDEESFDPIAKTSENSDDEVASLTLFAPTLIPSTITTISTIPQAPTPLTTALSTLLKDLPNFGSLFGFDHRLKTLEANFFEFVQTNQFAEVVSSILGIVQRYMDQRINEAVKVKVQVSKTLPKIKKTINEQLEAEVLTRSSNSSKTSYAIAADLLETELKKILIKKMEGNKSIHPSDEQRNLYKALVEAYEFDKIILDTYGYIVTLKRCRDDNADKDEEPSARLNWGSKRRREGKEPESTSAPMEKATRTSGRSTQGSKSQQKTTSKSASVEEPMQTTQDLDEPSHQQFETWVMQESRRVRFLEEVYKATTDQLDWNNPEGHQYLHNLLKPLPLIPNSRGHHVIPFDHFINNDLEYQRGGTSSRKYTTSVTKTKAADYGHIKWTEDLVPRTTESARDVYSKRRIIAVTELRIVEWHNYKHLDWITVRRDDDKKADKSDGRRTLCFQRLSKNVNKKHHNPKACGRPLTRYRFDLKRKEAYTAYSNPGGFIYQNKDNQNRLMRIDELHKFSDGTLNVFALLWMIVSRPEPKGSTLGYPLASVEVLRYDKRSKSKNMGIVPTEMELILEHTQQGISHKVSVSAEGVEE